MPDADLWPTAPVRLGDTALHVAAERDDVHGPDQLVPGFGNTMRDGLGVRAERGGVEIAIVGGLVLDPILGVRYASIGVTDGRVVSIGRAGNPDTMDGVDVVLDVGTAVLDATGKRGADLIVDTAPGATGILAAAAKCAAIRGLRSWSTPTTAGHMPSPRARPN